MAQVIEGLRADGGGEPRTSWSTMRARVEGFCCACVFPIWWLVFLLRWGLARRGRGARSFRGEVRYAWQRWRYFICEGFRPLRLRWWAALHYERRASVWRYWITAEWFLAKPALPRPTCEIGSRILVIRLGHPGDFLHAMPMLRALRQQRPAAFIALLVGAWNQDLARRFPYANQVIPCQPGLRQFHRSARTAWQGWREERRVLDRLRAGGFDTVLSLEPHHVMDAALAAAIRPQRWISFSQEYFPYELAPEYVPVAFDPRQPEHAALQEYLRPLQLEPGRPDLEFPVSPAERAWASQCLATHQVRRHAYVVIAPGAGWAGKIWPLERFAAVSDWLQVVYHLAVLVAGSAAEQALGLQFAQAVRRPVINLVGQTTLGELGAILEQAQLYLGNDNGLLHIAAALQVPTVALFGPTFAEKWAPQGGRHRVVQKRAQGCLAPDCFPWHPASACAHQQACMRAIEVSEVQQALASVLPAPE